MKFLFVTYTCICVHSYGNCIAYHTSRFKKKKKLFENPQTTYPRRHADSQLNTVKKEEMCKNHERNFHATVVTGMEVFDLGSVWRRVPSGLVLLWQSIQIMLSCLAPLKAQLRYTRIQDDLTTVGSSVLLDRVFKERADKSKMPSAAQKQHRTEVCCAGHCGIGFWQWQRTGEVGHVPKWTTPGHGETLGGKR